MKFFTTVIYSLCLSIFSISAAIADGNKEAQCTQVKVPSELTSYKDGGWQKWHVNQSKKISVCTIATESDFDMEQRIASYISSYTGIDDAAKFASSTSPRLSQTDGDWKVRYLCYEDNGKTMRLRESSDKFDNTGGGAEAAWMVAAKRGNCAIAQLYTN